MSSTTTDDGDNNWEDKWDEDTDNDVDDPVYDLQAVHLWPGQKRHLAAEVRETLCGRELGYESKVAHAQPGHCLEDYGRELRPISVGHNLPILILRVSHRRGRRGRSAR